MHAKFLKIGPIIKIFFRERDGPLIMCFLHDFPQKVWENSFSRFSWHFVQNSHKMQENSVLWAVNTQISSLGGGDPDVA